MFKNAFRRGSKRQTAYAFKGFPAREPVEFSRNWGAFRISPRNVKIFIPVTLDLVQPLHSGRRQRRHQRTRNEQRLDETDINHDAFIARSTKKEIGCKMGEQTVR